MKFGKCNTDYIFEVDGNRTEGWGKPRIVPYHNFDMHPFNSTIHYSIECFEGLKAYIDANKNVRLFRPELNMERLYKTALTLTCIPFDKNELLKCLEQFILIEKEWIPTTFLHSLYIRPTIISNSNKLILSPPESFKIYIVLTPVGNYFPKGFTAIDLTTEDNFARAKKVVEANLNLDQIMAQQFFGKVRLLRKDLIKSYGLLMTNIFRKEEQ